MDRLTVISKQIELRTFWILLHVVLLTSISTMVKAQENTDDLEGFYDLSSFETFSGLYLLQDSTFFYFSSFGNVDLKIYGTYTISSNTIYFQPNKELLEEFSAYGRKEIPLGKDIEFNYRQPYAQNAEKLYIKSDKKWFVLSDYSESNTANLKIKVPKSSTLIFGYSSNLFSDKMTIDKTYRINLSYKVNEIRIFHNYYAKMVTQFSETAFQIADNKLIDHKAGATKIQKDSLTEDVKNEIKTFIVNRRNEGNSIEREGRIFEKIEIEEVGNAYIIVSDKKGVLKEQ